MEQRDFETDWLAGVESDRPEYSEQEFIKKAIAVLTDIEKVYADAWLDPTEQDDPSEGRKFDSEKFGVEFQDEVVGIWELVHCKITEQEDKRSVATVPNSRTDDDQQKTDKTEGWIRVEDRLPEVGEIVLCYRESHYRIETYLMEIGAYGFFREHTWGNTESDNWRVTHWQNLPSPPEGEQK